MIWPAQAFRGVIYGGIEGLLVDALREVVGVRCGGVLVVEGAGVGSMLNALLREVGAEIPKYDGCLLSQLLGKAQGLCR